MIDQREFVSPGARRLMVLNVSMFAGIVLVICATNGMSRMGATLVLLGIVGFIAILWRRHGRMVFSSDTITLYNAGLSLTLRKEDVAGYVWRAPQNFLPFGDGIVFVAESATNGIGLRGLAPMATASRFLSPRREAALLALIEDWKPGITHYENPATWRSRSPFVRTRRGGVDPSGPPPRRRPH